MAAHSSILAWRIPGTGEPGGLPSLGSHRVGHDWSDLAAAAAVAAAGGLAIKNPPAIQETWGWSLGQDNPLEEEMATHSSTLAWRTRGHATVHGVTKSQARLKQLSTYTLSLLKDELEPHPLLNIPVLTSLSFHEFSVSSSWCLVYTTLTCYLLFHKYSDSLGEL